MNLWRKGNMIAVERKKMDYVKKNILEKEVAESGKKKTHKSRKR